VLQALVEEHRRYLDMLEEEYGPPTEEDVRAARKLLKELWTAE
jgi:hypothetical protein